MEAFADALAAAPPAQAMRLSRWGYAAASGAHVLGIALLVGAIVPYDLRLLGCWRSVPAAALGRPLRALAACGLTLALAAGALLFLADPGGYLANPLFPIKIALVAAAGVHALAWGARAPHDSNRGTRIAAALLSLTFWLSALALGRMLAFVKA